MRVQPIRSKAFICYPYVVGDIPEVHSISPTYYSDHTPDILLPLSARMGLPLYYCNFNEEILLNNAAMTEASNNPILNHLSLHKDGNMMMIYGDDNNPRPIILATRVDGEELVHGHVRLMWMFVEQTWSKAAEEATDLQKIQKFFEMVTPERFVQWWGENVLDVWECPVELGCGACGQVEAGDQPTRCERCGIATYCNEACRRDRDHLAYHRKVCVPLG